MAETAPCYAGGQWTQVHDLLDEAWNDDRPDMDDALKAIGFGPSPWSVIGDTNGMGVPLSLSIFALDDLTSDKPHFLIQVEGNNHGGIPHVFAQTLPDLMELLSRWAPAVQAAAVAETVASLSDAQYPSGRGDAALTKALRQFLT